MTKQTTAVGYVRVARVGGRGGDSSLSPELQREQIALAARREGPGGIAVHGYARVAPEAGLYLDNFPAAQSRPERAKEQPRDPEPYPDNARPGAWRSTYDRGGGRELRPPRDG